MIEYVYVASSWRNAYQPGVVADLREAGFKVYDFRHPGPGDDGFDWEQIDPGWQNWSPAEYVESLQHPIAQRGLKKDMDALNRADAVVLVQPCGRSAHLELGYGIGSGKLTVVYMPEPMEPELMLAATAGICLTMDEVVDTLATGADDE